MSWQKIKFNSQNIASETAKATIIKMPNKSAFRGLVFYHPSKLVREEGHKGYRYSFSFTDEWEFSLYKKGEIVEKIGAEEMMGAFDNRTLNNPEEDISYVTVIQPKKVTKEVVEIDELVRDEFNN
ncbi:MAG: hypothetical protein EOM50_15130 [Erysipelotrichia bacterium]|nr:hypothetical protein [Erysipelotrichia bacterium]